MLCNDRSVLCTFNSVRIMNILSTYLTDWKLSLLLPTVWHFSFSTYLFSFFSYLFFKTYSYLLFGETSPIKWFWKPSEYLSKAPKFLSNIISFGRTFVISQRVEIIYNCWYSIVIKLYWTKKWRLFYNEF